MNHLAHLFLSQSDIDLLTGNFIADHIKGNKISPFSEGVKRGIMMHRAIDTFTDQHALVMESKRRLYPKYHKYAAVLIDLFYDHILARNWNTYSPLSLANFSGAAYKMLKSQEGVFPEKSKLVLHYMSINDWLSGYATIEGMGKALIGISKRAKFNSKMDEAIVELERDFSLYEKEFTPFFKELFQYTQDWLEQTK